VVTLRPQTIDKYGRTVAEMFRNGQNGNLAMVSSGQAYPLRGPTATPTATPTGSIWAPAMAPPTSSSLAIRFHSNNRS
jgi:endonuclease YncB( thermonuclease family)